MQYVDPSTRNNSGITIIFPRLGESLLLYRCPAIGYIHPHDWAQASRWRTKPLSRECAVVAGTFCRVASLPGLDMRQKTVNNMIICVKSSYCLVRKNGKKVPSDPVSPSLDDPSRFRKVPDRRSPRITSRMYDRTVPSSLIVRAVGKFSCVVG